jgi:hypothetical protein
MRSVEKRLRSVVNLLRLLLEMHDRLTELLAIDHALKAGLESVNLEKLNEEPVGGGEELEFFLWRGFVDVDLGFLIW